MSLFQDFARFVVFVIFWDNGVRKTRGGGGYITFRVRVCADLMAGFLGRNSLNKGPFFGIFSIYMGGLSRNWRKIANNGPFSTKIHHKCGYESKFR